VTSPQQSVNALSAITIVRRCVNQVTGHASEKRRTRRAAQVSARAIVPIDIVANDRAFACFVTSSIDLYNKDMIAKPNDYSKIKGEFYWF
jgi:hypothetical protein